MAQERNGNKSHTGRNVGLAAVLLALLLGGGRYGLGIGRGGGGEGVLPENGNSTQSETVQTAQQEAQPTEVQETPAQEEPAVPAEEIPEDDGVLSVVVKEDKLFYEDEEIDLAVLEQALLRDYVKDKTTVTLTDDHAIKAAYDEVASLLDRLGIGVE